VFLDGDGNGTFRFESNEDVNWHHPEENIVDENLAKAEETPKPRFPRGSMEEEALRTLPGYVKTRLDDALEAQPIPTSQTFLVSRHFG
jgi:hypothetical protein